MNSYPSLALFYTCVGFATVAWLYAYRRPPALRTVIIVAIALRCLGFFGSPLYEDDFYRYLWDGHQFGTQGTPYGLKPSDFFAAPSLSPRMEEILGGVNYPEIPTIYGPVCQLSFLLAWVIAPGELWPLKLIYLLVDAAVCVGVWLASRSTKSLVLYAWCPLVIKEVAFTAHTDILAAGLLFLAWIFHRRERTVWAGLILGLAIAAKITVAFAAPCLLWRAKPKVWLATLASLSLCYAPFVIQGATDLDGLKAFANGWEFNSFGFAAAKAVIGDEAARVAVLAIYGLFCLYVCLRRAEWLRLDILLGAFLFLAPVINAWYLLLLAPFIAVYPSAVGIAALAAIMLSYITDGRIGAGAEFDHPVWVRVLEGAIVGGAALWSIQRRARQNAV